MGLLHRNPWKHGTRAVATVERVSVTKTSNGPAGHNQLAEAFTMFVTFLVPTGSGAPARVERKFRTSAPPLPGWSVDVAYLPDALEDIDYDTHSLRPPDTGVARGWSGGDFAVVDLGGHHTGEPFPELDRERALFRAGAPVPATVVSCQRTDEKQHRVAMPHRLVLRLSDDVVVSKDVWLPLGGVPDPGDLIQTAVSPDGTLVAIDTDERYDGPPGRALVITPGAPHETTREDLMQAAQQHSVAESGAAAAAGNAMLQTQLASIEAMHARGEMDDATFAMVKANLIATMQRTAAAVDQVSRAFQPPA